MEYTLTITGIRTYDTDEFKNIIKEVDWTLEAKDNGVMYNAAVTSKLGSPSLLQEFVPFDTVSEAQLKSWIESTPDYGTIKAHITEIVLKKLESEKLVPNTLPWMTQVPSASLLVGKLPPLPLNIT